MSTLTLPRHAEHLTRQVAKWSPVLDHADPPVRLEGLYAIREAVDTLIRQEDTAALAKPNPPPARLVTQLIAQIRRPS